MRPISLCAALLCGIFSVTAQASEVVPNYSAKDAQRGAQIRSHVGVLVPILFDPCPVQEGSEASTALAKATKRYQNIKDQWAGTAIGMDFVIAEADYDYEMSLIDILCAEPDSVEAQQKKIGDLGVTDLVFEYLEKSIQQAADLEKDEESLSS